MPGGSSPSMRLGTGIPLAQGRPGAMQPPPSPSTTPPEPESTGAQAGTEREAHAPNTVLPHLWCDSKCLSLLGILRTPEGPLWCTCTSWSMHDHRGRQGQRGSPADLTICTLQTYLLLSHRTLSPSIMADKCHPLLGIPSTTLLL